MKKSLFTSLYVNLLLLTISAHASEGQGDFKRSVAAQQDARVRQQKQTSVKSMPSAAPVVLPQARESRIPGFFEGVGKFTDKSITTGSKHVWSWVWDTDYTLLTRLRRLAGLGAFGFSVYEFIQYHNYHKRRAPWYQWLSGLKIAGGLAAGFWLVVEPERR